MMRRNDQRIRMERRTLYIFLVGASVLFTPTAHAQWLDRTVTSVSGRFENLSPAFGFEVGLGTSHVEWGQALPGSTTSTLDFSGYDALPGFDQIWSHGGQHVLPGQSFRAGEISFRNGSVATASSQPDLEISLDAYVYGSEFFIDNHPLVQTDLWDIRIRQTPNSSRFDDANADFIYFPAFPSLGSIRVEEGKRTTFPIFVKFGSLIPTAFGPPDDPDSGFLSPSIVDNPGFAVWTEQDDAGFGPETAQRTEGSGPLFHVVGSLSPFPDEGDDEGDMFLIRLNGQFSGPRLQVFSIWDNPVSGDSGPTLELLDLSGTPVPDYDPSSSGLQPYGYGTASALYLLSVSDPFPYDGRSDYEILFLDGDVSFATFPVPEPSTLLLGGLAAVGLLLRRRVDSRR